MDCRVEVSTRARARQRAQDLPGPMVGTAPDQRWNCWSSTTDC